MDIQVPQTTAELRKGRVAQRLPIIRTSLGGIDEINPEDVIYGEYSDGKNDYGAWIDLVYLDDDTLRTFTGAVSPQHPVVAELNLLLRDEKAFYVVHVRELPIGFAFKHLDIVAIKSGSTINGNEDHVPSCTWTIYFRDGRSRTLEAEYESYFTYGNTSRPSSMTNASILDKAFADSGNR